MFKLSEIKELIKLVDQTSIEELQIEDEGSRLHIKKPSKAEVISVQAAPVHTYTQPVIQAESVAKLATVESPTVQAAPKDDSQYHKITSPMVGTFYSASSPEAQPFVKVGDRVNVKSVVCILEAMKLMNELEAEVNGEIVQNGQLVEFGQPLFLVKAD
jgi:acetyl-CoA carboxylase biotin carboxyl carrier protein